MNISGTILLKKSSLEMVTYEGGMLGFILSSSVWLLVVLGFVFFLKKKNDLRSFLILLAGLTAASFTFKEYQLSVACGPAMENAGLDPREFGIERHFIHRGTAIRFSAITLGLIAATVFCHQRKAE